MPIDWMALLAKYGPSVLTAGGKPPKRDQPQN